MGRAHHRMIKSGHCINLDRKFRRRSQIGRVCRARAPHHRSFAGRTSTRAQLVNCFSFACDPAGEINGVPVATCHCPLGESLEGKAVEQSAAFGTQAGQGNTQICFDHPVGGPLPTPP